MTISYQKNHVYGDILGRLDLHSKVWFWPLESP